MSGSVAFYDNQGERLHTIYCAATPEYGKEKFKEKFSREIERVKGNLPDVLYVGVADGAMIFLMANILAVANSIK